MAGDVLLLAREHLSGRRGLQQLFYGRQQLLLQRMNRKAHPAGGKIFHVFALAAGDGIDVDEPVSYTHLDVYKRQQYAQGQLYMGID